ncbi:DoxX family protein [Microbispora hainanensis]|uniref:DoxX family protein n=1 Tax=Microbispora hainanensis TaxID=568844 RepID=UPI0033F7720E
MDAFLWAVQGTLAAVFVVAGARQAIPSRSTLISRMPWTADFPGAAIRLIGIAELAGAAGLVLPAATGIAPVLTPLAATGLALVMTLAAIFHARRHEYAAIPLTVVLFVTAAFTAWARFGPYAA